MVATVVNVQVKNEEKIETAPKKVVFDTKKLKFMVWRRPCFKRY